MIWGVTHTRFIAGWLVLFVAFCALGKWQLTRYHFKQNLLAAAASRMNEVPVAFDEVRRGKVQPVVFQPVKVEGYFVNQDTLLMQNQFYQHQPGVEVLTPLSIPGDKRRVLIDRGWVALPHMQTLPVIAPVEGLQSLSGHIKPLGEYQFILGLNIQHPGKRPLVIQKMDIAEISRVLKTDFYPFVLRLDASAPHGFTRDWSLASLTAVPPERHLGYAVQWFVMAFVLLLACVFYSVRVNKDD